MRQHIILILVFFFTSLNILDANAEECTIKGYVIDSISQKPIPFALIFNDNHSTELLTDSVGVFYLPQCSSQIKLRASSVGYKTRDIVFNPVNNDSIVIPLVPDGVILKELIVNKQKHKYSKDNNPAVDFAIRIREKMPLTDPFKVNEFYNYDKYEKITLGLNNFTDNPQNSWMFEKFNFLKNYIDTSDVSGKPILNVSVKEKASQIIYQRDTKKLKEYVLGIKRTGVDDITEQESFQILLEEVFREIDLCQNDISILQNRFVSPLSKIAPDFYKFYLTDTIKIDGEECVQLSFSPRNSNSLGFVGHIYVPSNDTTLFIKKVAMGISPSINLNFIEQLFINQEFIKDANGCRLKIKDDMVVELSLLPGTQGLYVRRNTFLSNHHFNKPLNLSLLDNGSDVIISDNAYSKDLTFWNSIRTIPISQNEENLDTMLEQLRNVPFYYWSEKIIRLLAGGYIHTSKKSIFDIGPINSFISYNDFEGWRFRVGGTTTSNLNNRLFTRGYIAYGINDKKLKYNGEVEYSLVDKKYHSNEFPINSITISHKYDVDPLGQHYTFTNNDNFFLSLKRYDDNLMTYLRETKLEYKLELVNNFSIMAGISHERQEATKYAPFVDGCNIPYSHYNQSLINLKMRYAPGEKFYQTRENRVQINKDAPIFELRHIYSPKGFLGNMFEINKTELSAQKRFWFSAFGYTDIILKGGHVWSKSPYLNLLLPNANLSYTIQPETFSLMNPLEFINDSYFSWDITYWANGAIFNYIPLLNKLKLRETFSFRGLLGHLSNRNNPDYNNALFKFPSYAQPQKMSSTPYMEVGVGIDNLLKIFRIDYVWRLTYRHNPNIDRSGVRIGLHLTF